jgi:hypothetical protein
MRLLFLAGIFAVCAILLLVEITRRSEVKEVPARWAGFRKKVLRGRENRYEVMDLALPEGGTVRLTVSDRSALEKLELGARGDIPAFPVNIYGRQANANALLVSTFAVYCMAAADTLFAPLFNYHFPQEALWAEALLLAAALLIRQLRETSFDWAELREACEKIDRRAEARFGALQQPAFRLDEVRAAIAAKRPAWKAKEKAGFVLIGGLYLFSVVNNFRDLGVVLHPHREARGTLHGRYVEFTDENKTPRRFHLSDSMPLAAGWDRDSSIEVLYDPDDHYPAVVNHHGWDIAGEALLIIPLLAAPFFVAYRRRQRGMLPS